MSPPHPLLLSHDVLRLVFDWIPLCELCHCAQVCSGWRDYLNVDDDILWTWKSQSTFWDYHRQIVSKEELRISAVAAKQLANVLITMEECSTIGGGGGVSSTGTTSRKDQQHRFRQFWLSSSEDENTTTTTGEQQQQQQQPENHILDMILLDGGLVVTCDSNGDLRSWQLPFFGSNDESTTSTHHPLSSTLLLKLDGITSFRGVSWLRRRGVTRQREEGNEDPSSSSSSSFVSRVIIAGRKRIYVVKGSLQKHQNNNNKNTSKSDTGNEEEDGDNTVKEESTTTLECRLLQKIEDLDYEITCVCLNQRPLNQLYCTGSSDAIIRVYNLLSENDGSAADENHVHHAVIDMATKPPLLLQGHSGYITRLEFGGQDGRLYSQGSDRTVRIWNPTTGECLHTMKFFDKEGNNYGTASRRIDLLGVSRSYIAIRHGLYSIKLFHATDGSPLRRRQHDNNGITISSKSRITATYLHEQKILCGTVDGSILGFDFGTGMQTFYFEKLLGSEVANVSWLVKDRLILALTANGNMCLVQASPPHPENSKEKEEGSRVVARILLGCHRPGKLVFSDVHNTLLISSPFSTARALVFIPRGQEEPPDK